MHYIKRECSNLRVFENISNPGSGNFFTEAFRTVSLVVINIKCGSEDLVALKRQWQVDKFLFKNFLFFRKKEKLQGSIDWLISACKLTARFESGQYGVRMSIIVGKPEE